MRIVTHVDELTGAELAPPYARVRLIVEKVFVDEQNPAVEGQPNNHQIYNLEAELVDLVAINKTVAAIGLPLVEDGSGTKPVLKKTV